MQRLGKSFKLFCANEELWSVPPELVTYDHSLAGHLETMLMASGDTEFVRRLRLSEKIAIGVGKTTPARKLVSMLAFRAIRDP